MLGDAEDQRAGEKGRENDQIRKMKINEQGRVCVQE